VYGRRARNGAGLHARRLLLDTRGGGRRYALAQVCVALRRASRPLTQAPNLACLGEDEQREHRDPDQARERHYGPDLGEGARER
jgi:hypothetical protein